MFPQFRTETTPSYGESNLRADFARISGYVPATPRLTVRDAGVHQFLLPICCSVREETK
jgi:hypothetical protein